MAVIGFIIVFGIGIGLLIAGIVATWASTQIGDKPTAAPLLFSAVGAAILYWACGSAPFAITLTGAAP